MSYPTTDETLRALLGCCFGRDVCTTSNDEVCDERADRIIVGHMDGREYTFKLCNAHADELIADTKQHE